MPDVAGEVSARARPLRMATCQNPLYDLGRGAVISDDRVGFEALKGVGQVIEHKLLEQHATSTDLVSRVVHQKSFYIDPHVKTLVGALGRNVFKTFRFCKALGLRVQSNAHREQTSQRTGYWLATRKEMAMSTTWATSVDATRFSGKDWQRGPVCNVESQKFAWMAPVVHSFSVASKLDF